MRLSVSCEVKLSEAELAPLQFDGEPQLRSIEGTTLQYVPNSPTPIILAENRYYAVQDGIWFVAVQLAGPWQVATSVPAEIYSIPPMFSLAISSVWRLRMGTSGCRGLGPWRLGRHDRKCVSSVGFESCGHPKLRRVQRLAGQSLGS